MKDEYTFENESENEAAYTINNDFIENDNESPINASTSTFSQEDIDRHRNIKCGIINTVVSLGINSIPIVVSAIRNKKSGIPVKIEKGDVIKAAVSTAFPILETVDAAFLGNKLTNKYHLKDVRNVTNVVITYPAAHRALNEFVDKTIRNNETVVPVESSNAKAMAWLGVANLITPYITDKMTNNNLSVKQKLNSVIPLPLVGRFIGTVANKNPKLRDLYSTATNLVKFTSSGARSLGNAVRFKPNSTVNKATNSIASIADTIGDVLGVPRGNIGGYGGGYYGSSPYGTRWGGSKW